jgi:hypothetical protein
MRLKVTECEGVYWINLNQDRDKWGGALANKAMNLQVL